jgi:large subunit ribosomal protein L25
MSEINLVARKREEFSELTLNQMRKKGMIPGIYYGNGVERLNIAANELDLRPVIYTTESNIVNLKVQDNSYSCILKDVQFHPLSDKPVHFDLIALKEGEMITIEVNIHLVGNAVGIKEGGVLQHILHKLELECLPKFIPSHIDVDVSGLNINDSIKVSDLNLENVNILSEENATIVAVVPPNIVKETTETAEETPAEPEVLSKGKKEDEE